MRIERRMWMNDNFTGILSKSIVLDGLLLFYSIVPLLYDVTVFVVFYSVPL